MQRSNHFTPIVLTRKAPLLNARIRKPIAVLYIFFDDPPSAVSREKIISKKFTTAFHTSDLPNKRSFQGTSLNINVKYLIEISKQIPNGSAKLAARG